jgi:lactase-phlorizin hydrolase
LNINTAIPASDYQADIDAAEREMQFNIGWFAHPILINGDYPQVMIDTVSLLVYQPIKKVKPYFVFQR